MVRNTIICFVFAGLALWLLNPPLVTPKSHTQRSSRLDDLGTLSRAVLQYAGDNKVFPRSTYEKLGLLSWRVQLLPYLGEQKLYDQIDKTVAWDHPNNIPFYNKMPDVFRDPASSSPSKTSYRIISGPGTGWTDVGPALSFDAFTDGLSNSISIVSVPETEINWLAPTTLTLNYASREIDFRNRRHCYSTFHGATDDDEPQVDRTGSPFLISDAE